MFRWSQIKIWLVFLAPSILIGMAVGAYPGYQVYKFIWYDAQFCTSCHVHDYATIGWQQSAHGEITTCHDCHHQRLRDYIWESYVMIKDQPKFPKDLHHTPYVQKELCAACHVSNAADRSTITGPFKFEDIEKIPKVDLSHLHSIHLQKETQLTLQNHHDLQENERILDGLHPTLSPDKSLGESRKITCADCHGGPHNRGHNFLAVDASCVRCHEKAHEGKVAKIYGCRSCHFQDFMIPLSEKKPAVEKIPTH